MFFIPTPSYNFDLPNFRSSTMIELKKAARKDIPLIYSLAEEIWHQHYPEIISMSQIEYMLTHFYSQETLEKAMEQGQEFYVIYSEDIPLGYIAMTEQNPGHWFMNKFYMTGEQQGKGLGSEVLRIWEQLHKPATVSLQVNRKNFKSINFYFKNGFRIREVADFDIGEGFSMDDFIMEKIY